MFGSAPPRPRPPPPPQQQRQLARLPEVQEVGTILVQGARSFARRHKYITAWYLLGVFVLGGLLLNGGSGRHLTKAEQRRYDAILNSIDLQAEFDATEQYRMALWRYQSTKGWFWSCDSLCQRHKRQMERAKRTLDAIRNEGNARMSDAKRIAGLSSDVAVQEMIDSFWQYFAAGKQFAKRQTGWDLMWMAIRSVHPRGRDESWAEYAIKILMHVLINFTMGLVSALALFVLGLWNILKSYQPNPIVAVLVFLAAASAASAFVATYSK
jgi:hypothetical protein